VPRARRSTRHGTLDGRVRSAPVMASSEFALERNACASRREVSHRLCLPEAGRDALVVVCSELPTNEGLQ
jgi:hypothetical protein